ncbi:TonB-dependent receptor [Bacteroidetes/Chlorobi group bacterium ChocPot_Mid]|nr:MAG: TonB-dependent receptor [Bacteroidetes/Chlorobi group bacterium ChocPot_Mid]
MKIIYLICITYFIVAINLNDLYSFDIKGKIIAEDTNEPLRSATIKLEKTKFGTFSDATGNFLIKNIPAGNYTIICKMVGFETQKIKVSLTLDSTIFLEIKMPSRTLKTNEVIVSANKRVQQVQEVPVSVSVIDLNSLINKNITDIDKALEYIPGIKMNGDHVSIRGSSGFAFGVGSKVAYLLDGFPLLSGDQGDLKFDIIPTFNIERIEVVKGAGSALYGTSALGGVINIITEEPKDNSSIKAKIFTGIYTKPKYKEWKYSDEYSSNSGIDFSYSQKFNDFGFLLSGRYLTDDSYRQFDTRTNINLFSKLKYYINNKSRFTLSTSYASNEKDDWVYWRNLDSATIPPAGTDMTIKIYSDKFILTGLYEYIFDNNDFLLFRTGLYKTFFENTLNHSNPDFRTSTAVSNNNEIQINNNLSNEFFLTSGLNFVYNTVEANIYSNNHQITAALYSQMEYKIIKSANLTLGFRTDYEKTTNSKDNIEFSPKIGFLFHSPFEVTFRASVGKGFRTATIAEKYAKINYGPFKVKENPDISPETSLSSEIGANSEFKFLDHLFAIDLSLFQNDMNNMIEAKFVEDEGLFIQFSNVSKARVRGIELDLKSLLFGILGIQSSVTLIDPQDLTPNATNKTLKYRSKILWYSGIKIPTGAVEFEFDYRFLSRADAVDDILEHFIPDANQRVNAHIIDARIIFSLEDLLKYKINLVLNANNLLDYYYTIYPGNLAPTRNITLQIDARL